MNFAIRVSKRIRSCLQPRWESGEIVVAQDSWSSNEVVGKTREELSDGTIDRCSIGRLGSGEAFAIKAACYAWSTDDSESAGRRRRIDSPELGWLRGGATIQKRTPGVAHLGAARAALLPNSKSISITGRTLPLLARPPPTIRRLDLCLYLFLPALDARER